MHCHDKPNCNVDDTNQDLLGEAKWHLVLLGGAMPQLAPLGSALGTDQCHINNIYLFSGPSNPMVELLARSQCPIQIITPVPPKPCICIRCVMLAYMWLSLHSVREPVSKIISTNYRTGLVFMVVNVGFKCRHFSQIFVLIGGIVPTDKIANRVIFHFRNVFLIVRSVVVDTQYYGQIMVIECYIGWRLRLG